MSYPLLRCINQCPRTMPTASNRHLRSPHPFRALGNHVPKGSLVLPIMALNVFAFLFEIFDRLPGSIPREKRSGSSAGVVGALPGRSLGRPAPRGRGLGPQSRAHRLYFQGPVFSPSPDLRREGIVFLRRDHDPETSDSRTSCSSSSSSSAQSMLQPTVYNVTTLPRPAAAGNTMRV